MSATDTLQCGSDPCQEVWTKTWPDLRKRGISWTVAQRLECDICSRERERRCRLLSSVTADADAKRVSILKLHPIFTFNKLDQLRREWLRLHDRQTGGVMGLLPCTWNLPVRFTHTLDKAKGVVKYARARLVGWELQDVDKERVAGSAGPELLFSRAQRRLFLEINEKTGKETQIYALAPKKVTW